LNQGKDHGALRRMQILLQDTSRLWNVAYLIPHANGGMEGASPIQGFAEGILNSCHLLSYATQLPMDIREMYTDRSTILFSRAAGIVQPFVLPIMIEALPQVVTESPFILNCILSTEDMVDSVNEILAKSQRKWLHVGPKDTKAPIYFEDLERQHFVDFLRESIHARNDETLSHVFSEFVNGQPFDDAPMSTDCPLYNHNITTPNDAILGALHISHKSQLSISPSNSDEYVRAATRSADTIRLLRKNLLSAKKYRSLRHDLTLALDSLTWPFLRGGIATFAEEMGLTKPQTRAVNAVLSRHGYQCSISFEGDENVDQLMQSPEVRELVAIRAAELRAFTVALSLLGTSTCSPTIRLNPGLNHLRGSLTAISGCARGNGPHQKFKLNKLMRRLSASVESKVGRQIINAVRHHGDGIGSVCLVTDMPLEWLQIDKLPLVIRHDVSRIPSTPGNITLMQSARSQRQLLGLSDFREILVVRSFEMDDPIAKHLEFAITSPKWNEDGVEMPSVKFVDVSNVDEFVDAINTFKGAVLIFDGHGTTDRETGVGSIVIGGQPVDVWTLANRVNVPPIVLLSACDTLPVDGSHGSTAIGMLSLGAVTVLGTLLPIGSRHSAIFVARLIYRIAKFLPILVDGRSLGIDWRYVMSGMLRMSYASELISQFERDFEVGFLESVRIKANMDINSRNAKWLAYLFRRLASVINKPVRDVWTWFDERMEMTDSLKYVQLGRPELIVVHEVSPLEAYAALELNGSETIGSD
jgi:hypothetical protein